MLYSQRMTGQELQRLRAKLDYTQQALANDLGVTANTVARWEREDVRIRPAMANAIHLFVERLLRTRRAMTAAHHARMRELATPALNRRRR